MDDRDAVLVVDDDENGREWARRVLARHTVVTTECKEEAWRIISQKHEALYAVLVNVEDFCAGTALIFLAAKVGIPHIGVVSETTPEELDGLMFSINGILASVSREDNHSSFNGVEVQDWDTLLRSLTTEGPIIISASIPYPYRGCR